MRTHDNSGAGAASAKRCVHHIVCGVQRADRSVHHFASSALYHGRHVHCLDRDALCPERPAHHLARSVHHLARCVRYVDRSVHQADRSAHYLASRMHHLARHMFMLVALALSLAVPASAQEQEQAERPHTVNAQIGIGGAFSIAPEQTVPADASESHTGLALTARLLWRPGHLLGIGVQSGFARISSLERPTGDRALHLSVVPAMFVIAMETGGFDASAAAGWQRYIVSADEHVISSAWEMSYSIAAAYRVYSVGGLALGVEASFCSIPERETGILSAQLRGEYRIEY